LCWPFPVLGGTGPLGFQNCFSWCQDGFSFFHLWEKISFSVIKKKYLKLRALESLPFSPWDSRIRGWVGGFLSREVIIVMMRNALWVLHRLCVLFSCSLRVLGFASAWRGQRPGGGLAAGTELIHSMWVSTNWPGVVPLALLRWTALFLYYSLTIPLCTDLPRPGREIAVF
jgi:hypothetical protein